MAVSAALIWTSAEVLRLGPGQTIEFCSLLNRILRERDPDLLAPACGVVRGINLLCVARREPSKLRYPPGGKSHRGGGLPAQHAAFFTAGKKFRVPMYLATSFDEDVAYSFWLRAFDRGEPPVHWIIQADPRGETSLRRRSSFTRHTPSSPSRPSPFLPVASPTPPTPSSSSFRLPSTTARNRRTCRCLLGAEQPLCPPSMKPLFGCAAPAYPHGVAATRLPRLW